MRFFFIICLLFASTLSFAQTGPTPDEVENRAREVGRSLRCVVCQNQSIEESEASLAKDMRILVRERIASGDSDAEIIDYMRSRYGDYVLLKPPFQNNTYLLWFTPGLVIIVMGLWFLIVARRKDTNPILPETLSNEDQKTLGRLLEEKP